MNWKEKSPIDFKTITKGIRERQPKWVSIPQSSPKNISHTCREVTYSEPDSTQNIANDKYIRIITEGTIAPFWGGGISLTFVVGLLFGVEGELSGADWMIVVICSALTIFFLIYYLTKPEKELILSRLNGVITFPGFYWQKNITMKFEDIMFMYTTGGEDLMGAFDLQIVRPHKSISTFESFDFGGGCYESMSFITWYMDKNRPLPPGSAFDPYRQQDYERRKVEGFPKPLYPSAIPTPEATKKQQVERKRIGGW